MFHLTDDLQAGSFIKRLRGGFALIGACIESQVIDIGLFRFINREIQQLLPDSLASVGRADTHPTKPERIALVFGRLIQAGSA